jgi:ABC-type uncharacterized transport system, permease component
MNFRHLKACMGLFKIHLAEGLQYRAAAIASGSIAVFWAFIELSVYSVFFTYSENASNTAGMTLPMAVTYVWLGQVLFALQPMNIDGEILTSIKNGNVGIALCRPLSLYWHWCFKTAGGRLAGATLRCVPVVSIGLIMPAAWRMSAPASLPGFFFFLTSVCCAFMLCMSYGMLVTAIRLNLTWGDGTTYMLLLVSGVLSGNYLPLKLWPDFMQTLLYYQPFAGYLDLPLRLYLGIIPPSEALAPITLQLVWTFVFVAIGHLVLNRRLSALAVQGG